MQFHVGETLYDWFFNARTGYRAQFRHGAERGHAYNRDLTSAIRFVVGANLPAMITSRQIVGDFEDAGTVLISCEHALQSLDPDVSKFWCCGRLLLADGTVREMIPSGSGPKLRVDEEMRWAAIMTSDSDAWLELNGAFLGSDGPYQLKPPALRGSLLQAKGEA